MKRLLLLLGACGGSDPAPCPPGEFCTQLSSYALFDDIATQAPSAGVMPYAIHTPLFSDYAEKDRFIVLPPGTAMTWSDADAFGFPEGAMVVKTFSYPRDRRDPAQGRQLLETRLLVREAEGWTGASYVYDAADQTDATLAIAGATVATSWIHDDGAPRDNAYVVPNKNQCKNCHAEHADAIDVLGPKARHLTNLQTFVDAGALFGAPPASAWPRAIVATDPATGTVEERARAWLDINCGNCHNARGGAARTSGLYLDISVTDPGSFGVCKPPVAAGKGSGGRLFGIVPGQPDASILVYRIESTEPEIKMPELGRNLVHAEGVALIREWITQLPGSCD
ncbi:MAG: SO2930 family diheme c-type cytochrome [Kofleriaceae bacterium]